MCAPEVLGPRVASNAQMLGPSRIRSASPRFTPLHSASLRFTPLHSCFGLRPPHSLRPHSLRPQAGWMFRNYTATHRGFDTFFGTSGNTGDYWYHTDDDNMHKKACPPLPGGAPVTDFVDASADDGKGGLVLPATHVNGTYDAHLLTGRAVELISGHDFQKQPMYVYLAYHNVHVPLHAPLSTVEKFPHIPSDGRKVANAMLLELDMGLGNITAALAKAGVADNTVWIVHTDNGGPGSHACNWPLRGGKFTFWEGGVRGLALVSSPGSKDDSLIPLARRGTKFSGLAHLSDLYATIVVGIAGGAPSLLDDTGPIQPDSFNLWPAIRGDVPVSPRQEVVHLPLSNKYDNTSYCAKGPGHGKRAALTHLFNHSFINLSTVYMYMYCYARFVPHHTPAVLAPSHVRPTRSPRYRAGCAPSIRVAQYKLLLGWPGDDTLTALDPPVAHAVQFGIDGGMVRNGDQAIGVFWKGKNKTHQRNTCSPQSPCLFDVVADPSEGNNLATQFPGVVANLTARLQAAAKTGPPLCEIVDKATYGRRRAKRQGDEETRRERTNTPCTVCCACCACCVLCAVCCVCAVSCVLCGTAC